MARDDLSADDHDIIDQQDLEELERLLSASGIDVHEASTMMSAALALVDQHGPCVAPARGHDAAIAHVWEQMTIEPILDHALADPAATERHEEHLERIRIERRARRNFPANQRSSAATADIPIFPGF